MGILDLVFPKTCLGCGHEGGYICSDCVAKVRLAKPICPYCERASIDGLTHVGCQKKLGLDGLISIWEYEGVVRKAILALKYKYVTLIGQELSNYFLSALQPQNTKYYIPNTGTMIPIPIHWHRQNVSGFNQSIEIGKSISGAMNWKFLPDLLIKKNRQFPKLSLKGTKDVKTSKTFLLLIPDPRFQVPLFLLMMFLPQVPLSEKPQKSLKERELGRFGD